jgi:hypothetical protein
MVMKFLCLAYGDEEGWNSLCESAKEEVLAQDEIIRNRGDLMAAVKPEITTVKNWNNNLEVEKSSAFKVGLPLAGFSIIEADNVEEVVALVSNSPCARAKGYIEIRPFWNFSDEKA